MTIKKPSREPILSLPHDQFNALAEAVAVDLEALRVKHHLTTCLLVLSGSCGEEQQWASIGRGANAAAETMLAWALGKATVQRQEQIRRLMIHGVIVQP
jgi:hypothetical protein